MSQPIGFARSNLFRVKDVNALITALENTQIEIVSYLHDGHVYVAMTPADGFWPEHVEDGHGLPENETALTALLADHLVPGEVAVLESISAQGPLSIVAKTVAVNAQGVVEETSLGTARSELVARLNGQPANAFTEGQLPHGTQELPL